ncbi:MAG TPA: DUF86 domain-containing protein [Candidatus Paceibacterota bacterium]
MLSPDIVKRKLSLIQDDLVNLGALGEHTISEVASDPVKQAALERFLERVINRAVDVNQHLIKELATSHTSPPKDYRETFMRLSELGLYPKDFAEEICKSIGTRNALTHEYDNVNNELIYNSVDDCLRDYKKYIDYVLDFLAR